MGGFKEGELVEQHLTLLIICLLLKMRFDETHRESGLKWPRRLID
jgi:hypothetical protein